MIPKIEFRRPYFITPHAISSFRQKVLKLLEGSLNDMEIIQVVNAALQVRRDPAWAFKMNDGRISKVYAAKYAGIRYYIPTVKESRGHSENWDVVPTILGPDQGQKKQEVEHGDQAQHDG